MDSGDLLVPRKTFFTTDGGDVWELECYFTMPSCTLLNLKTGERQTFGMGGLTAQSFKRIVMPEIDK